MLANLKSEFVDGLERLIRSGGECAQAGHEPLIFRVELATIIVHDRPYGPDCFAAEVEWNNESLYGRRRDGSEIGVTALGVPHEQWHITIEYVSAGTEIARTAAADMRCPSACEGWPIESLLIGGQQTDAG